MDKSPKSSKSKVRLGRIQKRLLMALQAGFSMALTRDPIKHIKIASQLYGDLKDLDKRALDHAAKILFKKGLVTVEQKGGQYQAQITLAGRKSIFIDHLLEQKTAKERTTAKWSGKWTIVMFDVPEGMRAKRNDFRRMLRGLGYAEMQRSVFVHPFGFLSIVNEAAQFLFVDEYVIILEDVQLPDSDKYAKEFGL